MQVNVLIFFVYIIFFSNFVPEILNNKILNV
jgi:hypothetical protein